MSLVCRDGVSECSGCRLCLEYHDRCDSCHRPLKDGDKYYRIYKKTICEDCAKNPEEGICSLCRLPAKNGIRYKDIVLCRSCSGVATGYIGYI